MRVNIQDVGFGVSQVLPIIVAGLMAGNESLLILEQPEIHLHPRLQAGIADFLIDLAQLGRRVLIETHSDHLINRLRRRAAEDSSGKISDYLQIAFVQRDYVTLESSVEALRVDDSGTVMNWPPSFLGDTADELAAILKAGIEKRKRAREHEGA
jgi:predicted ATPase